MQDNNDRLDSLIKWVHNNKGKTVLAVLGVFILILLFIQAPYCIGRLVPLIKTDFSASDVLLFFGSFLAFLGTVSLGYLAYWQNKRFKKENDAAQNKLNNAVESLANANEIIKESNEEIMRLTRKRIDADIITNFYSVLDFSMVVFVEKCFFEPIIIMENDSDAIYNQSYKYFLNLYFEPSDNILIDKIIFNSLEFKFGEMPWYEITSSIEFTYTKNHDSDVANKEFELYKDKGYVLGTVVELIFKNIVKKTSKMYLQKMQIV